MKPVCFAPAEILLPDFSKITPEKWSVIACDQYTSEPEYWERVEKNVGNAPSTLHLMLPEIYLGESEKRIPKIHESMEKALCEELRPYPESLIYVERTQADGRVLHGIVGAVDLEAYSYQKGATTPIRASEATVVERIPPRVKIRRGAPLELPHVILLIDDRKKTVIEPLAKSTEERKPIYDFDLMENGGHVKGFLLNEPEKKNVMEALSVLSGEDAMKERYGKADLPSLLFAVGDGNHSLATAKAFYEEIKTQIGEEKAKNHPARWALAQVSNLHDDTLEFEPIYRVLFGVDKENLLTELKESLQKLHGNAKVQKLTAVGNGWEETLTADHPEQQLTVGTLQTFLDGYLKRHEGVTIDYIHGEESLRKLASGENSVGFLFDGMQKDELFQTIIYDGVLPRKTFSMGHAWDKRYYLECRKITE